MRFRIVCAHALAGAALMLGIGTAAADDVAPRVDHHMHVKSALITDWLLDMQKAIPTVFEGLSSDIFKVHTGEDAVKQLDRAGIRQGVLLSAGYMFGIPAVPLAPEEMARRMRAENRYNVDAALASGGRLAAFVGINPFLGNALDELEYWSRRPGASGVKLHLGNSGFDLGNSDQVEALAAFFAAAGKARMPLVVHLRGGAPFTSANVAVFIDKVLPQAGDLPVQIAHGGSYGGIDAATLEALRLYGDAIGRKAPGTANLVLDISAVAQLDISKVPSISQEGIKGRTADEWRAAYVAQMRTIGLDRFVLASDWPALTPPAEYFAAERKLLPVTEAEWKTLCENVAPYLQADWAQRRETAIARP
ncbi:amidohydrolase family protein [Sphingosinicella soli]|uniref:Putative TIM-barrel fold metal-dependent hydrolase n=1 Tax=Sphingosinicella soli TaxID=333708 RepID=A0A7W7F6E4_9SPHN|nr:amidohydrolase family protein [Sphingosinicella soli]MBB4632435.1 putative TIM-barrel fold metal-dependent hydrolase [Sphingosinicella soli]